jgi:hypothetical protein
MPDRDENARRDILNRVRAERPDGAWVLCGYPGPCPPGVERVYDANLIRYVEVPVARIRDRRPVPPGGPRDAPGTVLIVEPDVNIRVRRTIPADLLAGSILSRLERLTHKCYTPNTRTPIHLPFTDWLDPDSHWPLGGAPDG